MPDYVFAPNASRPLTGTLSIADTLSSWSLCLFRFVISFSWPWPVFHLRSYVKYLDKSLSLVFEPKWPVEFYVSHFLCDFTSHLHPDHAAQLGTHRIVLIAMICWRRMQQRQHYCGVTECSIIATHGQLRFSWPCCRIRRHRKYNVLIIRVLIVFSTYIVRYALNATYTKYKLSCYNVPRYPKSAIVVNGALIVSPAFQLTWSVNTKQASDLEAKSQVTRNSR